MSIPDLKDHLRWVIRVANPERAEMVSRWYSSLEDLEHENRRLNDQIEMISLERDLLGRTVETLASRVANLEVEENSATLRIR